MNQLEKDRVIIFIDHANIWHQLKKINGRIDYIKFKNILSEGCHLVGALIFIGKSYIVSNDKNKFYTYLKKAGYVIRNKSILQTRNGKKKQKGIDILIYREITELAEHESYDKCILVSGDADFIDVVKKLKEKGITIEIWSFKISLSRKLIKEVGKENIHYIDDILDDIEYISTNEIVL